uniref:PHB domain-containing protein n=1 Tax=Macrostomum lignano TaxID=282301 RepID=A0A1I8F6X5_9PLAT
MASESNDVEGPAFRMSSLIPDAASYLTASHRHRRRRRTPRHNAVDDDAAVATAMRLRQRKRDMRFLRPDLLNPDIDILDENDETVGFCSRAARAVLLRLGRVSAAAPGGPGLFFAAPCCDTVRIVDLRTVTFDVPPQEVLTKDSVTVAVDAVVYYRIFNPVISVINVANADRSTRLLAQTTLRNVLGTKNLSEILAEREDISCLMQESLDAATDPWGVKVERVEIKDVRLPVQLQRSHGRGGGGCSGGARQGRCAKAASVIQQSPSALQLRYLHTVSADFSREEFYCNISTADGASGTLRTERLKMTDEAVESTLPKLLITARLGYQSHAGLPTSRSRLDG